MALGDWIDRAIEPFAPKAAARRQAARISLQAIRKYDAAGRDRRTAGWSRPHTGPNAESAQGIALTRAGARDLVRNNKYAAAGVRQMVASVVGDGIAPQFSHADPKVAQLAQDDWDRWAESKVDGVGDFYEAEKLTARAMFEGGESLVLWRPDATGPDGRIELMEGDQLDITKNQSRASGARIIQGVQFDTAKDPEAYWLFEEHPGDLLLSSNLSSKPVFAEYVDHVFERLRPGQVRGVSRLASVALTLRDIADIEDAVRLKKKVEACLALIITPGEGTGSPLTGEDTTPTTGRADTESVRPGMVFRTRPGEDVNTLIPSSTGEGTDFIRQQLAGVAANMVPYHLMTGDTSSATYTSLRAANLGHHALLDDDQQNTMIPRMCRPAVDRRLRRLALSSDRRVLACKINWALPVRRLIDPVKDLMAEVLEIRSGLKLMSKALAERGINSEEHMRAIKQMNDTIDLLGLALETDPRRLNNAGALQIAMGYLAPKADQTAA